MMESKQESMTGVSDDVMGKPERQRKVLQVLDKSNLALPPKVIHWNLQREGATFGERTVHRHLSEMAENGLVEKVNEKRGYYRITEDGRDFLEMDD